jgi:methionine sulfoxide reductase heme-binding subunit
MTTDPSTHLFWITSRAAGIVALLVASVSVSVGLLMSTRLAGRRLRGPDLRVLHEVLSLSTIVAIAVHAFSLLGDQYLRASIVDVTVPFAGPYKTVWTSIGIIAGWALVALGLSYYARGRIGPQRWRTLHRFTALAWLLGLVHALGEGSDAGQAWFLAMTAVVVLPALVLLARRLTLPAGKPSADGRVVKRPAHATRGHRRAAGEALGEAVHS